MKRCLPFVLMGLLTLTSAADQLYVRNRAFKGATVRSGKSLWVELNSFAEAVGAKVIKTESGGYRLSRDSAASDEPVPAGKVAVGETLLDTQEANGNVLINLDESARPLGLLVNRNPALGSIDVSLAPPGAPGQGASKSAGSSPAAPVAAAPQGPLAPVQVNRAGAAINLEQALIPGRVNIVDFYADWCGPCRAMAPVLEGFVAKNSKYALLKVDIKDWKSPVALQYGLKSIPHIKIYDANGKLMSEGPAAREYLKTIIK